MTGKNTTQNIVTYSLLWLSEMPTSSRITDAPEGMFTESMRMLQDHGLAAPYDGVWCLTTKGEDALVNVSSEEKDRFRLARQLADQRRRDVQAALDRLWERYKDQIPWEDA